MPQRQAHQGNPAFLGTQSIALPASHSLNIQRKIVIGNEEIKNVDELIKKYFQKADAKHTQIVNAWHKSVLTHEFEKAGKFKEAVEGNVETLNSWAQAKELFKAENFLFSTKGDDRAETLYFYDKETGMSGRLRQQHSSGPAAKIDKDPKQHRFVETLSEKDELKEKYEKNSLKVSDLEDYETNPKDNWYHIEYVAKANDKISKWHPSNGIVNTSTDNIASRISTALKEILGV